MSNNNDGNIMDSSNEANHLTFSIPSNIEDKSPPLQIKLHQATIDDDNQGENETNTGFVMWPAAVMLSHHLSNNPRIWRGDDTPDGDVMELGAGCGLPGLAAATLLQNDAADASDSSGSGNGNVDKVIFTDYNPAVLENLKRNILLNDFDVDHEVYGLDWFDQQPDSDDENENSNCEENKEEADDDEKKEENNTWIDTEGVSHAQFRLILGADLIVCSNDADLVANTLNCALMEGGQAVILGACAEKRFGVGDFPEACRSLGMTVDVDENILEADDRAREEGGSGSFQQLMEGLELGGHNQRASTSGHDFTMFTINKPITTTSA